MGTAPTERQSPAMPDPERVVARSLSTLRRLGMSDANALHMIIIVADAVCRRFDLERITDVSWPTAIIEAARGRLAVLNPSSTEHIGDDHGDGKRCD